jgi:type IV pilus assembly protein PilM
MIGRLGSFGGKDICAVDIGYHSVKVLQLSLARKKGVVRRILTQRTGLTPSVSAEEAPGYIINALTSLWRDAGIRSRTVMSAIPGRAVFVRQLRIPYVTGERLDRIVRYEAKQQIPFPVDQMKIDYHVFPSEGGELEVTLVAVKRDIIEEHVGLLRAAGLLPELIDVTSLALYNLQMDQGGQTDLVTAFVNIGASTTDIVIEHGGVLKFMRSAPVAGNALTSALERDLGLSFEEAEELKLTRGGVSVAVQGASPTPAAGEDNLAAAVRDVLESALERSVVTEIRKSIDFFISQPEGLTVNQIVITGGTSRLSGIETFMEDRLGIPVSKAALDRIQSLDVSTLDGFAEREVSSVVLGLAERQVNDSGISLNFTPVWIEERKRFRARRGALVVQLLLLIVILAGAVYRARTELYNMEAAWDQVRGIVEGRSINRLLDKELKERTQLLEVFSMLESVQDKRGKYLQALVELTRALPRDLTWIDRVEPQPGGGIVLEGRSYTDEGIEQFITEIRKSPLFFKVKLGSGDSEGGQHIGFKVTIGSIKKLPPEIVDPARQLMKIENIRDFTVGKVKGLQGLRLIVDFYEDRDMGERVRQVIDVVEAHSALKEIVKGYVVTTYDEILKKGVDQYDFDMETATDLLRGEIEWEEWAEKNRKSPSANK